MKQYFNHLLTRESVCLFILKLRLATGIGKHQIGWLHVSEIINKGRVFVEQTLQVRQQLKLNLWCLFEGSFPELLDWIQSFTCFKCINQHDWTASFFLTLVTSSSGLFLHVSLVFTFDPLYLHPAGTKPSRVKFLTAAFTAKIQNVMKLFWSSFLVYLK